MNSSLHIKQNKKKGSLDIYLSVGVFLAIIVIAAFIMFDAVVKIVILSVTGLYVLIGTVKVCVLAFDGVFHILDRREDWKLKRAKTNAEIFKGQMASFPASHNVFIHSQLSPQHYPALLPKESQPQIIEGQTVPALLDVMKTWADPLAIVGSMQSGKTNTAIAIAHSLQLPTLFVSLRNEQWYHYDGMTVYSEESIRGNAQKGIDTAVKLLGNYDKEIIFLDDIVNLAATLQLNIEPLIALVATQATAHNKRVFITAQSSDKASLGLNKLGAQLKNNFALLEMPSPTRDNDLRVIGHSSTGILYEPGSWKTGREVRLPGQVSFQKSLSDDEQFILDYHNPEITQTVMIEKYYGPKNGKRYNEYKKRVKMLGLMYG